LIVKKNFFEKNLPQAIGRFLLIMTILKLMS